MSPRPPKQTKSVQTAKVEFITIKAPEISLQKLNLLNEIKNKSHSHFTVSPKGIFNRIYPKMPKEYQELVRVLNELRVENFVFPERNAALPKVCPWTTNIY